ncbi:MAG: hypothetical protein ABEL76_15385 [Bradymonadaceae bacterium]
MANGHGSGGEPGGGYEGDPVSGGNMGGSSESGWAIDEGWSGGVEIGEAVDQVKHVWSAIQGDVLNAVIAVAAATFVLQAIQATLNMVAQLSGMGLLSFLASPIFMVGSAVVGAAVTALFAPIRAAVIDGWKPADINEVFGRVSARWVRGLIANLLLGVVVAVGTLCCIVPGLVMGFFFGGVPYLAVTTSMRIGELFERSFALTKRHWQAVLFAVAAGIAGMLLFVGVGMILGFAAAAVGQGAVTTGVSGIVSGLASGLMTIFFLVIGAGVWTAIDARESDLGDVPEAQGPGGAGQIDSSAAGGQSSGGVESSGTEW